MASAHFTPAKRGNHQVPAGKMASRSARWLARASRYRSNLGEVLPAKPRRGYFA